MVSLPSTMLATATPPVSSRPEITLTIEKLTDYLDRLIDKEVIHEDEAATLPA